MDASSFRLDSDYCDLYDLIHDYHFSIISLLGKIDDETFGRLVEGNLGLHSHS